MSTVQTINDFIVSPQARTGSEKKEADASFQQTLSRVLEEVNELQLSAGEVAEKFVRGEVENVHDVMIAAEKASVSLELTLEVRNKLIEAYRELMRIQM